MTVDERDALARAAAAMVLAEWARASHEIAAVAASLAEADEIAQAAYGIVARSIWARGILTRCQGVGQAARQAEDPN